MNNYEFLEQINFDSRSLKISKIVEFVCNLDPRR